MGDVASYGIGASVLGSFSDRFGRKKMIILAIAMLSLFHVSSSFAETYISYTCLQWAAGTVYFRIDENIHFTDIFFSILECWIILCPLCNDSGNCWP